MSKTRSLDLDAARREAEGDGEIPVTFKGNTFMLPAELPADVLDPFLSEEFDLPGLIIAVAGGGDDESVMTRLVKLLFNRPKLPNETLEALYESLRLLFGDEAWATFKASRPSVQDYGRLVQGVFQLYGTALGEASASAASSVSGGPTSKPTSSDSTESTPEPSGDAPEPEPATSESAD